MSLPRASAPALIDKLYWYGVAAASVVALATPDADAQVVSVDFDPYIVVRNGSVPFDFDRDADPELTFSERSDFRSSETFSDGNGDRLHAFAGDLDYDTSVPGICYGYFAFWNPLDEGVVIPNVSMRDVGLCLNYSTQIFTAFANNGTTHGWLEAGRAFMGLRFQLDATEHHGWIGLLIPQRGGEIRIGGYAYNATPNASITTGEVSTAAPLYTLDASLSQTTFPPEGGLLVLTAAVTNTTGGDARLDLWAVGRRDGEIVFVRRLGTGTVAAANTETRSLELEVPAWAPAATYEVRIHVGTSYPAVADTEVFTITKEGAPGVGGEDEGDLFVGGPVEGDLFTGFTEAASVSQVGLAGTNVLSAAAPNPSRGQAAFTLEVAETQAVRVAVYDALGREVAVLHDGAVLAGAVHRLTFDASALPSGVYAVRAVGERFTDVRTLTLMR